MIHMLSSISAWWRRPNSTNVSPCDMSRGFHRLVDSTLLNPAGANQSCSLEILQQMCKATGFEPATRTLVRSFSAGHTVQVFLLKNTGRSDASGIPN